MAGAVLVLSSCGNHSTLYNFTRHGVVDLRGAVTLQGRFSTTEFWGADPHACAASVHASRYPNFGYGSKIAIDGQSFSLDLYPKRGVGTSVGNAVIGVGNDFYVDPSSTITLRADGGGSVSVQDALNVGATTGGPALTGTVRWSCRDEAAGP